ncbi:hypothetical protein [Actinomadura rugatobispora]|uniref:DUF732 domain-containing protein n=1 Tax=Actinomadura rugatobispora TaxID=1994 RepID=A0ABW0ZTY2_9ACTN|nr:hypothetical protein GCM10010200_036660 [Actinomadura rugatobispora]
MRLAVAAALLALAPLAGCSGGTDSAGGVTPSPTPTPSPTVQLDSHARLACEQLDQAVRKRAEGGSGAELEAGLMEFRAVTSAKQTEVVGMYDLAKNFTGENETGDRVERELRWWCQKNWAPGR